MIARHLLTLLWLRGEPALKLRVVLAVAMIAVFELEQTASLELEGSRSPGAAGS